MKKLRVFQIAQAVLFALWTCTAVLLLYFVLSNEASIGQIYMVSLGAASCFYGVRLMEFLDRKIIQYSKT